MKFKSIFFFLKMIIIYIEFLLMTVDIVITPEVDWQVEKTWSSLEKKDLKSNGSSLLFSGVNISHVPYKKTILVLLL